MPWALSEQGRGLWRAGGKWKTDEEAFDPSWQSWGIFCKKEEGGGEDSASWEGSFGRAGLGLPPGPSGSDIPEVCSSNPLPLSNIKWLGEWREYVTESIG